MILYSLYIFFKKNTLFTSEFTGIPKQFENLYGVFDVCSSRF